MIPEFVAMPLPAWAEILTGFFAVLGAAFAAIGSFGLVRMPTFFRRIHTPTLGATAGVWCITIATIVYFSVQGFSPFLHAVLITLFIALTAPVTTIFLMRAALFRERQKGGDVPAAHPGDALGLDGSGNPKVAVASPDAASATSAAHE